MKFYRLVVSNCIKLLIYDTVEHGEAKGVACIKAEANVSIQLYFVYILLVISV